jgi:hypothetical protein
MANGGFTAIRNGLLDHALAGKLAPFDFGLYVFLIMRADFATGIYQGCAGTIAYQFGDPELKEQILKSLRRLRDKKYINYRKGHGSRGAYSILINKFSVTVGELCGTRLNAWKHGELCQPEYEAQNSRGRVEEESRKSRGGVAAPNKDLRLKTEDVKNLSLTESVKKESANACEICGGFGRLRQHANIPGPRLIPCPTCSQPPRKPARGNGAAA